MKFGLATLQACSTHGCEGINTIDDAIQAIVGGNAYVNVHTIQNQAASSRQLGYSRLA